MSYPNGQVTNYSYFSTSGDLRLQEIQNLKPSSANLSKFDYTYDAEGEILTWRRQADSGSSPQYALSYDPAAELTEATDANNSYVYGYDLAGNRTSEQINLSSTSASFNNLNQLVGKSPSGPVRFSASPAYPHG